MFIRKVQSNLKQGVDVTLGRFTLLVGRNGAGKSSVIQALQLAADGLVRDGEGREELKTSAAIARFFPAEEKNVYATATLDDGTTVLHWEAKRAKGGSIKVATPARPVTVVFPVQEVQAVLASDDKKVRAWLSKNVLPSVTQALVESTLPEDEAALIVKLVRQKNLEWDWSVISTAAKAEATLLRRDATAKEGTVETMSAGLPLVSGEIERAEIELELGALTTELQQASGKTAQDKARLETRLTTLAASYDALEAQIAKGAGAEGAVLASAEYNELRALSDILTRHVQVFGTESCAVCGTLGIAAALQERQASVNEMLTGHGSSQQRSEQQVRLAAMLPQLQDLVEQVEKFVVVDTKAITTKRDAVLKKLADEQNAERTWASIRSARGEISRARADANLLTSAADSLDTVGRERLKVSVDAFRAEVNAFLPPPTSPGVPVMQLGIDVEASRLGFARGANVHTALSGGEWTTLLLALAAWRMTKHPPAEDCVAVLTPEDRAWDGRTLCAVMDALEHGPWGTGRTQDYQVVLMSTVMPEGPVSGAWQIVEVCEPSEEQQAAK